MSICNSTYYSIVLLFHVHSFFEQDELRRGLGELGGTEDNVRQIISYCRSVFKSPGQQQAALQQSEEYLTNALQVRVHVIVWDKFHGLFSFIINSLRLCAVT